MTFVSVDAEEEGQAGNVKEETLPNQPITILAVCVGAEVKIGHKRKINT